MAADHLLRVSSFNYPPYHVITEQGFNVPVKGICGEILAAITRSLKTNYTITFPLDSFWGLLKPDGNWTGVLGMLQRDVWLLAFCGFLMSAVVWSVGDYIHFRLDNKNGLFDHVGNFLGRLWAFVESTLLEASPVVPSRISARILVGAYWLVVIILTTAFAGQMKAMLMVRQEADRIDSLKDLSERPTMKPYAPAGSAVVSSIRYSRDPYYQKVWRMMQKFKSDLPPAVVLSDSSMREIIRGKAVLILSRPTLAERANEVCANSSEGEFYVGRVPTFEFNSVFYLNKRMPATLRDFINKRILWLRDSGLLEKWWRESSGNWEGCGQATSDGTLTFADFSDLIKLLLAMLACACVVCLTEVAVGRGLRTPQLGQ
ncbi:glutamate receptor ionotropic, kainate glr-3-like isoform X2 [Dermacentor albipictus]|uniref:glutamate receptor ionotropic, kainate glr-3-like isoform X2 n=1 Tax=Dermacentor albipictus TaxID=60249 RepID=UPI0038FC6DB0